MRHREKGASQRPVPRISEVPSSVLRDERVASLSEKRGDSTGVGPNLHNVGGCHLHRVSPDRRERIGSQVGNWSKCEKRDH